MSRNYLTLALLLAFVASFALAGDHVNNIDPTAMKKDFSNPNGTLGIANGGTGATTAAGALTSFGISDHSNMTVESDSDVGIGTTTPDVRLTIFKSTYPEFRLKSTSITGTIGIDTSSNFLAIGTVTNHPVQLKVNSNEIVNLTADGCFRLASPPAGIPTPTEGGIYYSATDKHLYLYNGSEWKQLDN